MKNQTQSDIALSLEGRDKMSIQNFNYNGFMIEMLPGVTDYKIKEFIKWTNDPGIGLFLCTDDKERLIPSCQLTKEYKNILPERPKLRCFGKNPTGVLFGTPSQS